MKERKWGEEGREVEGVKIRTDQGSGWMGEMGDE